MKHLILPIALIATMITSSCGNSESSNNTGTDSSAQSGMAPVESTTGTPTAALDTTTQAGGMMSTDSAGNNGTMQSNTTDRRTTSGSAAGSNPPPGQ